MPKIKTPRDDIIREEEAMKTVIEAKDLETKAAISMLWLTGCRIGELAILKLKDIKNFEEYVEINMPTLKQRKPVIPRRKILIPKSSKFYIFIKNHINNLHPKYDTRLTFESGADMLYKKIKLANPDIYPHLFRHSRATILSEKLDIFDLKYTFGWTDMAMPARYIHRKDSHSRVFEIISDEK